MVYAVQSCNLDSKKNLPPTDTIVFLFHCDGKGEETRLTLKITLDHDLEIITRQK